MYWFEIRRSHLGPVSSVLLWVCILTESPFALKTAPGKIHHNWIAYRIVTEKSCFTHFMHKVPWVKTLSNHLPLATSTFSWSSLVAQMVKKLPAVQKASVGSLGWEDSLEEGMATHSSILAWRIPMDRGAYSPWGHKESDTTERLSLTHWLNHFCQTQNPTYIWTSVTWILLVLWGSFNANSFLIF